MRARTLVSKQVAPVESIALHCSYATPEPRWELLSRLRIGFDDNRSPGRMESGGRAALPVFREIVLKVYREKLVGPAPRFPARLEENIDAYLRGELPLKNAAAYAHDGTDLQMRAIRKAAICRLHEQE